MSGLKERNPWNGNSRPSLLLRRFGLLRLASELPNREDFLHFVTRKTKSSVFYYLSLSGNVWRCFFLAEVRVQEGEPLENALRRFKRKVQTEDIIKEVKRHSFYLKPGEKKRVKEALARKRNRKKVRKEQD
jgi:small subunit ribosomal protein S21